jgi:hypothetical protein
MCIDAKIIFVCFYSIIVNGAVSSYVISDGKIITE